MAATTNARNEEVWDRNPISLERFGKDHWSTFAYIETRVIDFDGYLDLRHMRGHLSGWEVYPTRLREVDGSTTDLKPHNDFDCADDLVEAGLIVPAGKHEGSARATRRSAAGEIMALTLRYALTPRGAVVAGKLREHVGNGGKYHYFEPGVLGWHAAQMHTV